MLDLCLGCFHNSKFFKIKGNLKKAQQITQLSYMPDWQDSGIYPWGKAGISFRPGFQIKMWNRTPNGKTTPLIFGGISESQTKPRIHSALLQKPVYTFKILIVQPMGLGGTGWDAPFRESPGKAVGIACHLKILPCSREEGSKQLLLPTQRTQVWEVCLEDRRHQLMVTEANAK